MRIFNLVGVSFAAHIPNCNSTDHSIGTFDEYSCDGCHGTKYDERCWSNNDPHGGLGRDPRHLRTKVFRMNGPRRSFILE